MQAESVYVHGIGTTTLCSRSSADGERH